MFCKLGVFKNFAKLTGKDVPESLFDKVRSSHLRKEGYEKETPPQDFSCECYGSFKNIDLEEHLRTAASVKLQAFRLQLY